MRKTAALLIGAVLMFATTSAMALPIPPTPFTIGGITFSDFTAVLTFQGTETPTDLSGLQIIPETLGPNAGFQIAGGFSAFGLPQTPTSFVDLMLHYKATSSVGLINDVELSFNGSILHDLAFASVVEKVYSDANLQNVIGTAIVQTPTPQSTHIVLSEAVNTVWVTKDIMLNAFYVGENGIVVVSDINQTLSTTPVPEPGTMMLLGVGFLGLAIYGKRRKNA